MSFPSQHAVGSARGDSKHPDLSGVVLGDADLDVDALVRALAFEERLRVDLVGLALAAEPPEAEAIDAALGGAKTAAARTRFAQSRAEAEKTLADLEAKRQAASAGAAGLSSQVAAREQMKPPQAPAAPSLAGLAPGPERDEAEQRYAASFAAYKQALQRHNAALSEVAELRSRADAAAEEVAACEAAIERHKADAAEAERDLENGIAEARDHDLVLELDRLLARAGDALRVEGRPVEGFWTLLAAGGLVDLIEKAAASPAFAAKTRQRFMGEAAALGPLVERDLAAIAKGCLSGPTAVARAHARNRAAVAALSGRLSGLAAADLDEGLRRARAVIAPPPEVPAHAHLELPAEIEAMSQRLAGLRASACGHAARLRSELDDGVRREVERVLADAAAAVRELRAVGDRHAAVLARSKTLWTLIGRGASSRDLPAAARALSAALPQEFARREGGELGALMASAESSRFALEDAQALVETPALADYVKSGEQLRRNVEECDQRVGEIDRASASLAGQIDAVAGRYRARLASFVSFGFVPVVGLVLAFLALRLVERLKLLVASGEQRYAAVAGEAPAALHKAAVFAGAGAAVAVVATALVLARLGGGSWPSLALVGVSLCCLAAAGLFAWSLVRARALAPARPPG